MKRLLLLFTIVITGNLGFSQGLLDELESQTPDKKEFVSGTFKSVRVINGHSVEIPGKGELVFIIQHRFGSVRGGIVDLIGLDQANIRFGLEYTMPFFDRICIGVGRSSYLKVWDGFIKYQLVKESKGPKSFPFTIDLLAGMGISTINWPDPARNNYFSSRLTYWYQILWAKKFCRWFSFQLSPTLLHRNLVPLKEDQNTTFHLGFSGRFRVSNRVHITAEYFWPVAGQNFANVNNVPIKGPLSFGVDWETGGHVFQFVIGNTQATYDQTFIGETFHDWLNGDIHIGFNIVRTFSFKKGAGKKYKVKGD